MRCRIFALVAVGALATCPVARAAKFSSAPDKDRKVIVTLTGEIVEGDSDAFKNIVRTANSAGHVVGLVRLNSPGGSILESVKIAEIIQFGKIATSVIGSSTCASACFIVFAAGNEKFVNYTASVGVHGASDASGQETTQSNAATVTMARVVKELGVPSNIIGKMVVTPPDQMVWLTPDDLRSMGTLMTGKPAQVPIEQPFTSQLPQPLNPKEKSLASKDATPPSWDKMLDRAIQLSSKQHNGTPDIERVCQPDLKECINGLSFKAADGTDMIMKVTEDMNGKLLKKEVCSFNKYGDIRDCLNWDTGEQHRDMKNKNGDWYRMDNQ